MRKPRTPFKLPVRAAHHKISIWRDRLIASKNRYVINGFTLDFLCSLPIKLPQWPHQYLTVSTIATLPAPKSSGYCSIIIDDRGQVYYSGLRTNTLIMHTRSLAGLTHPAIWLLASPELFTDNCPPLHQVTAWMDNHHGFLGLGSCISRPLPWFSIHAIQSARCHLPAFTMEFIVNAIYA